jgi:hypothetical protein
MRTRSWILFIVAAVVLAATAPGAAGAAAAPFVSRAAAFQPFTASLLYRTVFTVREFPIEVFARRPVPPLASPALVMGGSPGQRAAERNAARAELKPEPPSRYPEPHGDYLPVRYVGIVSTRF